MTTEQSAIVMVRADTRTVQLAADLVSAATRALKADPGDRSDVVRYEGLAVQLEQLAVDALAVGAPTVRVDAAGLDDVGLGLDGASVTDPIGTPLVDRLPLATRTEVQSWIDRGDFAVLLRLALAPGRTVTSNEAVAAPDPLAPWQVPDDEEGRRAVQARFAHS